MSELERTNWWPLGLLAYWWQGSVMKTAVADGKANHMVQNSQGFEPVSLLYVTSPNPAGVSFRREAAGPP